MVTVSVHPFTVHMKPYAPGTVKPLMPVVGDAGEVMTVAAGLVDSVVHVPVPVAAMVTG